MSGWRLTRSKWGTDENRIYLPLVSVYCAGSQGRLVLFPLQKADKAMSRPPDHDPGYENRKRNGPGPNEYESHIICTNCGWKARVGIQKGLTVEDAIKDKHCKRCLCNTLVKA